MTISVQPFFFVSVLYLWSTDLILISSNFLRYADFSLLDQDDKLPLISLFYDNHYRYHPNYSYSIFRALALALEPKQNKTKNYINESTVITACIKIALRVTQYDNVPLYDINTLLTQYTLCLSTYL
ncbi:hypothetical protein J3Q64DRAFT_1692884 [Phycomyces blakesleeanus]|uniref:Uncharacterized protein n=2 Tax=Phycomyces blakesleeanus TaxID=4837 RepID=A0A162XZR7_PHYB8|nr:hypothetical protein PHYBLDRAFT_60598 [Phycomyces blakesleeanus NRRL 1555(-)]OAD77465.1 hypothetical protein PHYBLDRAFT_60598 [Phycomyces blakesleeanus NRRL 1555(-)]|eukprot:XP_018295505.1 hypothetical protein PHYBLDRAFT_60598 [Phycomyces blakesleeanus NRRL 1555(-)]